MTQHQARRIWRFVRFHREKVGAFVVHCHQGMSRSPAVAAAIASYLLVNDRKFLEDYTPNRHVYEWMLKTMPKSAMNDVSEFAECPVEDSAKAAKTPRAPE